MQRFVVGLTPLPTAARVTRHRSALRRRIVTSLISLVITAALLWFFRDQWSTAWLIGIGALWLVSTVLEFTISIVGLHRAKRDLARIPQGPAFLLGPIGVEFVYPVTARVRWEDVSALRLRGGARGAGPRVALESGGTVVAEVPLSFLDAAPAVIDSMVRAYSLARVELDTRQLDRVI